MQRTMRGIRMSDKEWKAVQKTAKRAGQTAAEWVRCLLRRMTGLDKELD